MRIQIVLEPDMAVKLKQLAHQRSASFNEILNDVLRKGLRTEAGSREQQERFVVDSHAGGLRPEIGPAKLNQLVDELEIGDFVTDARLRE